MTRQRSQKLDCKQHLISRGWKKSRIRLKSAKQGAELSTHESQSHRDFDQELRAIQYWPALTITSAQNPRHCHRQNSPVPIQLHRPDINDRPPLTPNFGRHSTLSGGYAILLRWMERQGCEHASQLARFNRVLPNCFLNPQRFDGDMFETTTTSQHDGTA